MVNEKKINAIADAEQAGLYYSSNTEEGFTREIKGETHSFFVFFIQFRITFTTGTIDTKVTTNQSDCNKS